MWQILILLSVVSLGYCDAGEWKQVRTAQGEVRGRKDPASGVYEFLNIPYAKVPVGKDRFKAPLPGPLWLEPLEAVDRGIICMQPPSPFFDANTKTMQEDCLITNIYVPDTDDTNLPVIVYIHGGAFEIGYGNMMTPKHMVKDKKVIVLNFNYRLGVHGFLCLGTEDAPGNAGLKDQVALLRWVKKNIASFGGNPDDVTIAGCSAGSVSVDLLMLSKSTKGLFNKVILESGVGVGFIAIQRNPIENAKTYAKMLNFTNAHEFFLMKEFYKSAPMKRMFVSTFLGRKDSTVIFSPCIERKKGNQAFLDESPYSIIRSGKYNKVPMLIGISNMEGSLQMHHLGIWKDSMNTKFSDFIPVDLTFRNNDEREMISKKIKEFYFGDQPVVQLHLEAGHKQIYLYEFSFVDDSVPVIPNTNERRAQHCSQTMAVLEGRVDEETLSEEYRNLKSTIREMWTNFAIHGTPVPENSSLPTWPTTGADGTPYMSIGNPVEIRKSFLGERGRFWNKIYEKYYSAPSGSTYTTSVSQ
ncbi:hypothetical protein SFRURICE_003314 [Spodoptera frugiperda]|nr:hypothetical protein SFRURICE_003314 [Spodoptera frugiperda]